MRKERELLNELTPIFLKYNWKTVSNCMNYILENEKTLVEYMNFINGIDNDSKGNNLINELIKNVADDKKDILSRINKFMNSKGCTAERINICVKQVITNSELKNDISGKNKKALILKVMDYMKDLDISQIIEFENILCTNKEHLHENSLENWGKVIVKEKEILS